MIDTGSWYLDPSRRNRPAGFVYAVTSTSSPSIGLNWRSVYGDIGYKDYPFVKIQMI